MKPCQRLTREQRYTLGCLGRQPGSEESIARALGVHPTTAGREFRRAGMNRQTYCHLTAQQDAQAHA